MSQSDTVADRRRKRAVRRASLAELNDDAQNSEIAVFFLDESDIALTVANSARVRHVCVRIAAMLGLVDDMDYALFTLRADGLFCLLNEEVSIVSVQSQCRGSDAYASAGGYARRIFYRRWFWHPRSLTVIEELSTTSRSPSVGAHLLAFADARTNFVAGHIEVPRLEMALLLAALLLTCDLRHRGGDATRPKLGKVRVAASGEPIPVTSRAFRAFLAARLNMYLPPCIVPDGGARRFTSSSSSGSGVGGALRRGLHSLVNAPKQKKRAALVRGICERYLDLFVHAGMAPFEAQSRFLAVARALPGYGAYFQSGVVSVALCVVARSREGDSGAAGGGEGGAGGGVAAGSAPPPKGARPDPASPAGGEPRERNRNDATASSLHGLVGSSVGIGCKGVYLSLRTRSNAASSSGAGLGARIRRKSRSRLADAAVEAALSSVDAPLPSARRRSLTELLRRKASDDGADDAPPADGSGAADASARASSAHCSVSDGAGGGARAPAPRRKRRSSLTKLKVDIANGVADFAAGRKAEETYFFPFGAADAVADPSDANAHTLTLTMHPAELPVTAALEITIAGRSGGEGNDDASGGAARRGRGAAAHQIARMFHKIRDAATAIDGGRQDAVGQRRRLRSLTEVDWIATTSLVASPHRRHDDTPEARLAERKRRASLDGARSAAPSDRGVERSGNVEEQRPTPQSAGPSGWWCVFIWSSGAAADPLAPHRSPMPSSSTASYSLATLESLSRCPTRARSRYRDDDDIIRGPFSLAKMTRWTRKGYFEKSMATAERRDLTGPPRVYVDGVGSLVAADAAQSDAGTAPSEFTWRRLGDTAVWRDATADVVASADEVLSARRTVTTTAGPAFQSRAVPGEARAAPCRRESLSSFQPPTHAAEHAPDWEVDEDKMNGGALPPGWTRHYDASTARACVN